MPVLTNEQPGRPITFDALCRVFRRRVLNGDDWVAIFDCDSRVALDHIKSAHYRGVEFDEAVVAFAGERFVLVALPKSKMRRWQYEQILRGYGARLPGATEINSLGLVCVAARRMAAARVLVEAIEVRGEGLAMKD
jgi:hypothetical protein